MKDAIDFFYRHAGWLYQLGVETEEDGRLRSATYLAEAEAWMLARHHEVEWSIDGDADRSWLDPDDDRPLFGCVVAVIGDDLKMHGDSMWGIDLGEVPDDDDPYKRVVVAELAAEIKRSLENE